VVFNTKNIEKNKELILHSKTNKNNDNKKKENEETLNNEKEKEKFVLPIITEDEFNFQFANEFIVWHTREIGQKRFKYEVGLNTTEMDIS